MSQPKPAPHDIGAERALIGSCLKDIRYVTVVRSRFGVTTDAFYKLKHGDLWAVLGDVDQSDGMADLQKLRHMLKARDKWESWTAQDLIELSEAVTIASHAEYHAKVVMEYAAKREVLSHSREIAQFVSKPGSDVNEIMGRMDAIMESVQRAQGRDSHDFADALAEAEAYMEALDKGKLDTVKTGIEPLDDKIHGFVPGELVVIAGRPSSGKTALACVIAFHLAKHGHGVSFISAESTRREIATRIMRTAAGVDYATIQKGQFEASIYQKWCKWRDKLKDKAIQIDDTSRIYVEELYATALEHVRRFGARVIIVDHVQRIQTHHKGHRYQQLEYITDRCKILAREANVPVLLLSQLNRKSEGSPSMPKSCGAIEEIADTMVFLRYDAAYDNPDAKEGVHAERILDVTKKREGPTGKVPVIFQKDVLRFIADGEYDMTPKEVADPTIGRDVGDDEGVPF